MTILSVEQNADPLLKVTDRAVAKKLDYQVYKEFIQIFLDNLEERMKGDLLAVVLYGSVARGNARPESDIDLLILYRKGEIDINDAYVISSLKADESPKYQQLYMNDIYGEISPMLMTLEEIRKNPLILLDIMEEGIILFEQDKCFTRLLKKMKAKTKKLGSRKMNLPDGSWYWELKPTWKPGELIEVAL